MNKTKVVVIGTGTIAKEHLKCLKEMSNVEVVGVCDLSPAKAESTAERFKIPHWSTKLDELIQTVKPDIAHVTTNPASHFSIAQHLLNSGISVLVEKPITPSFEEFQILKSLADNKGLILLENHNYTFNPPVQQVLELIQNGIFGEVKHLDINLSLEMTSERINKFSSPGTIIEDFLTHFASLCYTFIGRHEKVYTSWKKIKCDKNSCFDEFCALVEAKNGTASIHFSTNTQPDGFWMNVYGSKMRASINLFESRLILEKNGTLPRPLAYFFNGISESATIFNSAFRCLWNKLKGEPDGYSGLRMFLKSTYNSIDNQQSPPIPQEQLDEVNRLVADIVKQIPSVGGQG